MSFASTRVMFWAALIVGACGGKAAVEPPGPSGTGGSTSSSSSTSTSSTSTSTSGTGGSVDCPALEEDLLQKIADAQWCDAMINALQCTGDTIVMDTCGCEVVANDIKAAEAMLALEAYADWVSGGCGPYDCYSCPPPPDSPWYCDPYEEQCLPAYEN